MVSSYQLGSNAAQVFTRRDIGDMILVFAFRSRSKSIRSDGCELEYTVRSRSSASRAQRWSVAS